ncbi:MAG: hypothetical protein AB7G75_15425 [Candidatus Binatia bacterium]
MQTTEDILDNLLWLVESLDGDALRTVDDIPMLEMAKCVRIARSTENVRGTKDNQPRSLDTSE